MAFSREKSIVRFDTKVNYINNDGLQKVTRSSTRLLGTRTSSLSLTTLRSHRQTHQYIPRLHRQVTEIPRTTPLGCALKEFARVCLRDELSMTDKTSALDELRAIMNNATKALSRNLMGLQFSPPVYALGFSHWQTQSEKRVVCYLPVRLPKVEIYPIKKDIVLLELPRHFHSSMHIDPKDLEGFKSGIYKFTSSKKFCSLVMKILKRTLFVKSVDPENINFSSSDNLMEITLLKNRGWIGEIVPCVVVGKSDSSLYSCRPLNEQSVKFDSVDMSLFDPFETSETHSQHTSRDSVLRCSHSSLASGPLSVENIESHADSPSIHGSVLKGREEERLISSRNHANPKKNGRSDSNVSGGTTNRPKLNKLEDESLIDSTSNMEILSDIHWYPCNPQTENNVFETISKTDGGMRMTAMMIVCKLVQHDWRLLPLSCYHVQTAMLHDLEHRLDNSPRWQRDTLEHCVRSLLSTLYKFTKRSDKEKGLPHFGVNGVNIWAQWDEKQQNLAASALKRLVSTDTSLLSLVCRAGGISLEDLT